jgi:hypothetical protein
VLTDVPDMEAVRSGERSHGAHGGSTSPQPPSSSSSMSSPYAASPHCDSTGREHEPPDAAWVNCNEYGTLEEVLLGTPTVESFHHCPHMSVLRGLFHVEGVPCGAACQPTTGSVKQATREIENFRRVRADLLRC